MTFDEYAEQELWSLTECAKNLVRMGWNARGERGSCPEKPENSGNSQGILDGSDHIADARKMVQGNVALAGDITDEGGTTFHKSLLVQFTDDASLRAAVDSGQCRFTVFGGEV